MGRLTEKNENGYGYSKESLLSYDENGCINGYSEHCIKAIWKLAEYEDLDERGLLLRLPVAEGSIVYVVEYTFECKLDYKCPLSFDAYKCEEEIHCEHECKVYHVRDAKFNHMMLDRIGKTVFLTKEEAEQALEKMKEV